MKPLVVFDIETTGLDKKKDYIIQFAAIKYDLDTNEKLGQINYFIQPSGNYTMSIAALAIHRITPKFLSDKPFFADVALEIYDFIKDCDILTYNGLTFDAPFLKREFHECGIEWNFSEVNFYDSYKEELRRNSNTLGDTFKRYTGMTMEDAGYQAHDAFSDINATLTVFLEQNKVNQVNPEVILTEDGFIKRAKFCDKETEVFAIGKWANVSLEYVVKNDRSYMSWVANNVDFDRKTRTICESYLQ